MSKIGKKLFDIMIISNDDGRIRKYKLSKRTIKFIIISNIILVFMLLFFVLLSIFLYGKFKKSDSLYKQQLSLINEIKNKSSEYKSSLEVYSSKINSIHKKISLIEYYSDKFLKTIDKPKSFLTSTIIKDYPYDTLMYDTYINYLDDKTDQVEKDILYSYSVFQENENILLSTPSIWPVRGWLSSYFGEREDPFTKQKRFHDGLDIANNPGTPIKATANGVVIFSGERGGYGNTIVIKHNHLIETRYAHLQGSIVIKNQKVKKGEVIGYLGNSGRSSGPHLHYEVRKNNIPTNPMNYILR